MTVEQVTHEPPNRAGAYAQGRVNWRGMWTLYAREVQRFLKIPFQTVLAPVATTLLFLAIFTLAFGASGRYVGDVPYVEFLAPGLIMMAVIQNSFANTSSSLMISKVQGNIVDILMPPLSAAELTLALALGGVTRGIAVALSVGITMWIFAGISILSLPIVLFYGFSASLMLALIGTASGIWADKFDQIATITNFVVIPLSFLSGTFYSVEVLPGIWYTVSHFNPLFFLIDGFRAGFLGHAESHLWVGALAVTLLNIGLFLFVLFLFRKGYKLKP